MKSSGFWSKLTWDQAAAHPNASRPTVPATSSLWKSASEHVTEVFTAFGRTGARAEKVADEVVRQVRDYLSTDVPIGPYLADQIMLPLGISAWQAETRPPARRFLPHVAAHSSLDNAHRDPAQFLDIDIRVEPADGGQSCTVSVGR